MTHFSIRFSKEKDDTNDSIASLHKIYKDINSGTIKESYVVLMNGPFLRSETESIINLFQQCFIEKSGNYIKVIPHKITFAAGSSVYNQELADITYFLDCFS